MGTATAECPPPMTRTETMISGFELGEKPTNQALLLKAELREDFCRLALTTCAVPVLPAISIPASLAPTPVPLSLTTPHIPCLRHSTVPALIGKRLVSPARSEEHTSELQSL